MLHNLAKFGAIMLVGKAISALLGAVVAYWQDSDVAGPRTMRGFLRYCLPRELLVNPNIRIDICFVVLNRLAQAWVVLPISLLIAGLAPMMLNGLTATFGVRGPNPETWWNISGLVLVCIVVRDLMEFLAHFASHRWQFLWEFHQVHHSSEFLSPMGEKRSHVVEDAWRVLVSSTGVGVCMGVYAYAFGMAMPGGPMAWLGIYATAFTIATVANFSVLHHSHIPMSYGPGEWLLISPAQHQLHHDREGPSRNFGSFLAVWDRLLGSFARSKPRSSFVLGLPPEDQRLYRTIPEMYIRPFFGAAAVVRGWLRSARTTDAGGSGGAPAKI